jgi:hypothetical protein
LLALVAVPEIRDRGAIKDQMATRGHPVIPVPMVSLELMERRVRMATRDRTGIKAQTVTLVLTDSRGRTASPAQTARMARRDYPVTRVRQVIPDPMVL